MKQRILLNFLTANTGGVVNAKRAMLLEYDALARNGDAEYFVVMEENDPELSKNITDVRILPGMVAPDNLTKKISFYERALSRLCDQHNIDCLVNFGDIPARVKCRQIFYFDWPYAVYDDADIWFRMSPLDTISKLLKRFYFWITVHRAERLVAQTYTMKQRLLKKRRSLDVVIVDVGYNPIEVERLHRSEKTECLRKLIYPTVMYPHKNVEVLIEVAKILREHSCSIQFCLTFDAGDGPVEKRFVNKVAECNLEQYFEFSGRLTRRGLVDKIFECDGMIMPTLLETYGHQYLESQVFKRLMFTSDRDFARELCGDAAVYFEPTSAASIANAIIKFSANPSLVEQKLQVQELVAGDRISWRSCVAQLNQLTKIG